MYESFYGLKEKPFSLLPDPAYLYLSKQHEIAMTLLEYSLENQAGFCVITGKAGTGKTTLLRRLLNQVGDDVSVGLISNTHHSFGELMRWILHAFGLEGAGMSRAGMHQIFVDYLIAQYAKNRRTMLIIDEAQNMAADALEELRMLSNINSDKDLLLQVILVGQPPLRDILRRPELEQFAQRIAVDYHLDSLSREETRGYILHRIVIAGGEHELFMEDACDTIYEYCGGNPRLINLLCDLSLVYAYASQAAVVTSELVEQVVTEREKYGALPLFASITKTHVNQELPSRAVPTVTTAMTSDAAAMRVTPKAVSFRHATEARGAIPNAPRDKAAGLSAGTSTGNSDRAGRMPSGNDAPARTGSRARPMPAAVTLGSGPAGTANISAAQPKLASGTGVSATAEATNVCIGDAIDALGTKNVTAVTQDVKPIAKTDKDGKPHKLSGMRETESALTQTPTAEGAPRQKPGDFLTTPPPTESGKQAKANSPSRNVSVKSDNVKHPGAHMTKRGDFAGGIAAGARGRLVSGHRRYIPAMAIIGLMLAASLVWCFAKPSSPSIHAVPIVASPPVAAAVPVVDATPAKVTPAIEPPPVVESSEDMSPVGRQTIETTVANKDTEEMAKLESVERERDAAQARAKKAERDREAMRNATLARERALAEEHEAALARERANQLALAAEKAREEARAAEAARLAEAAAIAQKKTELLPPPPAKVSIDPAVSESAGREIVPKKAEADSAANEKPDEPTAFTANPCKGPSARFLSTCE